MNIVAIIQARCGSTRLPQKVLLDLNGKTVLNQVVNRVKKSKYINEVVVATTNSSKDDLIVIECEKIGCKYFRGDEFNVLDRYYHCAKKYNADVVIRITSDCPFIDSTIIDDMIRYFKYKNCEILNNIGKSIKDRTYPRGFDTEIFEFLVLEKAFKNAIESYQKEHVTPYIYENFQNIHLYKNEINYSKYRLTLDTEKDYKLIKKLYDHNMNNSNLEEIVEFIERKNLFNINSDVLQKDIKE